MHYDIAEQAASRPARRMSRRADWRQEFLTRRLIFFNDFERCRDISLFSS